MNHRKCIGTCTDCGKENTSLIILDDVDWLCEECLDSSYTQCDICGEYWGDGYVEFTVTADDKLVCEYCMEDIGAEELSMRPEETMWQLIRVLVRKGASEDLIEAVVSILETDENFLKMINELYSLENPSETCILGKAMLIADPS